MGLSGDKMEAEVWGFLRDVLLTCLFVSMETLYFWEECQPFCHRMSFAIGQHTWFLSLFSLSPSLTMLVSALFACFKETIAHYTYVLTLTLSTSLSPLSSLSFCLLTFPSSFFLTLLRVLARNVLKEEADQALDTHSLP